jgi:hypothetical protein
MLKRIKLNHDENYSKRLQKTPGGNPQRQGPRGCQVGPAGPTYLPFDPWWWAPLVSFQNVPPPPP